MLIHYQSFDGNEVDGGTIDQQNDVDLHTATTLAQLHAGPDASIDLTSVITTDGRELITQ